MACSSWQHHLRKFQQNKDLLGSEGALKIESLLGEVKITKERLSKTKVVVEPDYRISSKEYREVADYGGKRR